MENKIFTEAIIIWNCWILLYIIFESILHVRKKKNRKYKIGYFKRYLFFLQRDCSVARINENIIQSLPNHSPLKRIISKSIKGKSFNKLTCWPVELLQKMSVVLEKKNEKASGELVKIFDGVILDYNAELKEFDHIRKIRLILILCFKELLCFINLAFYFYLKDKLSLYIFIGVNSIGLLVFMLYGIYTALKDEETPKENELEKILWLLEIIQNEDDATLIEKIRNGYVFAPVRIKPYIKELVEEQSFYGLPMKSVEKEISIEGVGKNLSSGNIMESIDRYVHNCHLNILEQIETKAKSSFGLSKQLYQLIASLGIMVNVTLCIGRYITIAYGISL